MSKKSPKPSDTDRQLMHTLLEHIGLDALKALIVSVAELSVIEDDPRAVKLRDEIQSMIDRLLQLSDEVLDTIPGVVSREEAEKMVTEIFDNIAALAGGPSDTLFPKKEILH